MTEKSEPDSQEKQAWVVALRLLAATPKSRRDLFSKLADKGFPEEMINRVLDGLERQGLLSDKAFAQDIVARYVQAKPSGSRRIGFELKKRGVPNQIRQEILEKLDPEQERERAEELAREKWERFKNLEPQKRKKKVYDFLLRRGFEFDVVREAVGKLDKNEDA